MAQPKRMKRDDIAATVAAAITEAVDYTDSSIAEDRLKAQRYYDGEVDIGHEQGRSKVVATKCRDVVRAVKPALMRAFMAADKPVEFVPVGADDVQAAEQATAFAQWKFTQKNGYQALYAAFHDALVKKTGVIKAYFEEYGEAEVDEYTSLTEEQAALVIEDPEIEILEYGDNEDGTIDMKVTRKSAKGDICLEAIAPEDFFVSSSATCLEDAYVCGNRNAEMRVGDVVAMGYDFETVSEHAGDASDAMQDEADLERRGYHGVDDDENAADPSMRKVLLTEAFMRMDIEGAGVPQLYRFICIGTSYELLDYELADDLPFAVFMVDPEPHTFYGHSLVEILLEDQDAATAMLRGTLDNVALTNTPNAEIVDGMVNHEDMLNNEIGKIVRVKQAGSINYNSIPFAAGATLPALQYFDEVIESKTGVSRAAMGMNPDVLQGTTATAVNAMTQAATGQVELMARNLAEGGMRQLFRLLMRLARQHSDEETMMQINGSFVPVDPRSWRADMDLIANVGIGTGGEVEREMVLREVLQHQAQIWQAYGPGNGLVTMTQMRNTLADIMKLGGIHNADRYFLPIDYQTEQMLIQQAQMAQQAAAEGQQDPAALMAQAEVQKATIAAQAKLAGDQAKRQQDGALKVAEMQMDAQKANQADDLKRDEMIQKRILEAADLLGKYGVTVDLDRIAAMQAGN